MNKLKELYFKYKEIINYLIFGVLTTVVSLVAYYVCVYTFINPNNAFQLQVANIISWIFGVLFAYITNRKFVFESNEKNKFKEAGKFVVSRLATLLMDMAIMFVGVTIIKFNDKIIKLISQAVVIIMNYVLSKLIVFKKKACQYKIRENLIKLMAIGFFVFFIIVLLNTIFFNRTTQINYNVLTMLILLGVFYFLIYILYKKLKTNNSKRSIKKYQIILCVVIIFILQLNFAILTFANCGWDCGMVMNNAYDLAMNNRIDTYYFSRCSNNIGMLLIVTYIIRFINLFCTVTMTEVYLSTIIFNIIIVDISAILTFNVCRKMLGEKIANLSILFIIPLIMFLPYIIIPYTDTISMIFPILILYLYMRIKDENHKIKKKLLILLEGVLTVIGYYIKPTTVIVTIAICIIEVLRWNKVKIKEVFSIIFFFTIGCIISYLLYSYIENENLGQLITKNDYETNNMPMTHYLKIGLKEVDSGTELPVKNKMMYGTYNDKDVASTMANSGKNEKIKENLKTVKSRLEEFGITGYIKFLYNKANWILSDGTFFFGQEGTFWSSEHNNKSEIGIFLQELINNKTDKYQKVTCNIFQTSWILLLLGLACSYTKKYESNDLVISKVVIIGIVLFLLLFEGRSRYLVNHIPIFIIVGLYGLINSFENINKIKINKQLLLASKGEKENE